MNESMSRVLLYGGAVLCLGGLGAAWATSETEADAMTLLSSADVQLRMAYAMPAVDKHGNALDERANMIATAIEHLDMVERIQPGMAVTAEFRGFAHMLDEEFDAAAACYRQARQCADCDDEQRDVLAFNQARMLARAGKGVAALEVFAAHAAELDARYGHQRRLEEATILRELERFDEARSRLDLVLADANARPMARLQAGRGLVELGDVERAESVLKGLVEVFPIADYYRARLKLRQGDVDSSCELLERAQMARPAEVRRLLQDEADAWSAVAEHARFRELTMPQPASPGR